MATLKVLIQTGTICHCLQAKTLFYERFPEEDDTTEPVWCAHTQSVIGPDGGVVDARTCRPGRTCCEVE
jgi:hypothetical protein